MGFLYRFARVVRHPNEAVFFGEKMQKGWIKLYRKIQYNEIWTDEEPFDHRSAFIDLLLTANHEEKKIYFNGQQIEVKEGQRIVSVRSLAARWKWPKSKVERFLDRLEKDGMIKKESDTKKTLLTIENYSKFQSKSRDTNEDTDRDTEEDTNWDTENRINTSKTRNRWDTNEDTNRDTDRDTNGAQSRSNKKIKKNKNDICTSKEQAKKVVDLYNQKCPSLPQVEKLTDGRIRSINARLKEYTEDELIKGFEKAEASAFLRGENGKWKASFDWIMKPGNLQKINEGNYDDKKKQGHTQTKYDFKALQKMIEGG